MVWESKVIERDVLYREIWSQPMTVLAKKYGISDVALRKVCVKLNVPAPRAGHWAKVRHGKRVPRPALPAKSDHLQHEIRRWVEPESPGLDTRLQRLVVEVPKVDDVPVPTSAEEWHKVVRNTEVALDKGRVDDAGRLVSEGRGCCELRVTPGARSRAVRLCEQLIRTCVAAGLKLEERLTTGDGPRLGAGEGWYRWRITETGTAVSAGSARETLGTTAAGRRRPPPAFRIDFVPDAEKSSVLTYRDNADGRLEAKVGLMPGGLLHAAAVAKLKTEMAEEKRCAQEARWKERQRRVALKEEELGRLKVAEDLADRFRRAQALRSYSDAIEQQRFERLPLDDAAVALRLRWLRQAADWLDPTRHSHWAEVDDAHVSPW